MLARARTKHVRTAAGDVGSLSLSLSLSLCLSLCFCLSRARSPPLSLSFSACVYACLFLCSLCRRLPISIAVCPCTVTHIFVFWLKRSMNVPSGLPSRSASDTDRPMSFPCRKYLKDKHHDRNVLIRAVHHTWGAAVASTDARWFRLGKRCGRRIAAQHVAPTRARCVFGLVCFGPQVG